MNVSYPQTWSLVNGLDLEPIKFKLTAVGEDYEWSLAKADMVEIHYKRFLYLIITHPEITIAPTAEVDAFWHAHILDTRKYFQDCATIANRYLHHFPYLGMLGEDDKLNLEKAGRERLRLLNSEFDLDSEICMELESVCSGDAGCKSCKSCGSQGVENLGVVRARPRPARPIPDTNRTMLH